MNAPDGEWVSSRRVPYVARIDLSQPSAFIIVPGNIMMKPTTPRLDPLHRHFLLAPPVPLYHYTSLDVLEKITSTGTIWATDVHYLNDKTEYRNARTFIEKTLEERLHKKRDTHAAVESHFQKIDKKSRQPDVFVTSFSKDGDSLPQWRGYGANGQGVAIGFLPAALKSGILQIPDIAWRGQPDNAPVDLALMKCVYKDSEKDAIITESVDSYLSAVEGTHPRINFDMSARLLSGLVDQCSPLFKDESFKEEREWRLVMSCAYSDVPDRHFSVRRSMMIPYIKIDVKENYAASYISAVCIGPTAEPDLARKAVKKLLAHRGLNSASVQNSSIPYRTW